MLGLACPSCGDGAVVPDIACPEDTVNQMALPAGTGSGACNRHADAVCNACRRAYNQKFNGRGGAYAGITGSGRVSG